jgi:hypothetical protein
MPEPTADLPHNHLMEFLLGLLAPLLMAGGMTDIHLARLAATEAITAYRVDGPGELVTIGQIVAFALAALDNLRLSMTADLSLSMKLKLRGNANALNRCARDNTNLLQKARRKRPPLKRDMVEQAATVEWDATETNAEAAAQVARQETETARAMPPTSAIEHQNRLQWASVMKREAERLQANARNIPPAEQRTNSLWIDVLTEVASDLAQGKYPVATPGMSKSDLLRSTLMTSGSEFPTHLLRDAKR